MEMLRIWFSETEHQLCACAGSTFAHDSLQFIKLLAQIKVWNVLKLYFFKEKGPKFCFFSLKRLQNFVFSTWPHLQLRRACTTYKDNVRNIELTCTLNRNMIETKFTFGSKSKHIKKLIQYKPTFDWEEASLQCWVSSGDKQGLVLFHFLNLNLVNEKSNLVWSLITFSLHQVIELWSLNIEYIGIYT